MDRFQRNVSARPGHQRAEQLRAVIRAKLQEHDLLTPQGKRVASRGRGESKEALQNPDTMETQDMSDSQSYLSPVRPMQDLDGAPEGLHRGKAKSNLSEKECLDDTDDVEEIVIEEEEEEEGFDDDVIVEVGYQDNETIQILSDDDGECAMSPQKPSEPAKADEPMVDNIYARTYGGLWGQPVGPAQEMPDTQLDSQNHRLHSP